MGIFSRKPSVEKLTAKNDVGGLLKATKYKDVREKAIDSIRNLLAGKQGRYWVQLVLHYGLFDPDEDIRKSIAQCLSSIETAEVSQQIERLEETESRGWAALLEGGLARIPDDMWTTGALPHKPDEKKLAERVTQFKTWMGLSLPRKDTAKRATAKAAKGVTIRCEGCGKTYTLGKDAIVVSASAIMRGSVGTTIIGSGLSLKNTEDTPDLIDSLVGHRDWSSLDEATVRQQQAEISRISSALSSGNHQWWRCRDCGTVQIYRRGKSSN